MERVVISSVKAVVGLLVLLAVSLAVVLGYARHEGLMLLSVQTGSMRPVVQPGDAVLIQQNVRDVRVGSIVSYRSLNNPKAIITHRVISVNNRTGSVVTKGDALQATDPPIGRDRIIGKAEHIIPLAGYSFDFIRHPLGLVAAVYMPAVALIYGEIRRLSRFYAAGHYRLLIYFT